jgi:hypothetical protein
VKPILFLMLPAAALLAALALILPAEGVSSKKGGAASVRLGMKDTGTGMHRLEAGPESRTIV